MVLSFSHRNLPYRVFPFWPNFIPRMALWRNARGALRALFGGNSASPEILSNLDKLDLALPGNVTVSMALALDEFARVLRKDLKAAAVETVEELEKLIKERALSEEVNWALFPAETQGQYSSYQGKSRLASSCQIPGGSGLV